MSEPTVSFGIGALRVLSEPFISFWIGAVVTGLVDTEHIEIISGLKPGELIITQGLSNVREGTVITTSR